MPQLKSYLIIGMLALAGLCYGCTSGRNTPLKPDTFVGDYIYFSADSGSPHDPDRLTLRPDGKYILIHMPGGHPGSTQEGTWRLYFDPEPRVLFGGRVYPIEVNGKEVLLLIDLDLGHSYQKIK